MLLKYVIPLPPVTKKNSQRILTGRRGNKYVAPSEQYERYEAQAGWFIRPAPEKPIDYPVTVKCLFYMPDRRRCDLTNLLESIDDILVKTRVLKDDCYAIIASHDGSRVFVDKEKPRTEICIERFYEDGTESLL